MIINDLVYDIFKKNWESVFIYSPVKDLTYRSFWGYVLSAKSFFIYQGVTQGSVVCLVMENSIELMASYFSLLTIGAKVAPIDPLRGEIEKQELIQIVNPDFVYNEIYIEEKLLVDCEKSDFSNIEDDAEFLITFTSGSTGEPKGTVHSFKNLYLSSSAFGKEFKFNNNSIFLHCLPMTYMAGILNLIFLPFFHGSKIVLGKRFSASEVFKFWDVVIDNSINVLWVNPTILFLLFKVGNKSDAVKEYLKKTELIVCVGTAPLYEDLKNKFETTYDLRLYQSYGLSETLFVSTECPGSTDKLSAGRILNGVDVTTAEDGELMIKTPWNLLRFWGESEGGKEHYASGDIGNVCDGKLYILDRKKEIIIRGGVNLSPSRIEILLQKTGYFEEVAVVAIKDICMVEKVVCFYVGKKIDVQKKKNIMNFLTEELGSHYAIDNFCCLIEMPKNINHKIDKKKLRELYNNVCED